MIQILYSLTHFVVQYFDFFTFTKQKENLYYVCFHNPSALSSFTEVLILMIRNI